MSPSPQSLPDNMTPHPATRQHGFTLVEVLVALTIVSIALLAGSRAIGALTNDSARHVRSMLAQACAENALGGILLASRFPNLGQSETQCVQGSQTFKVVMVVQPTPNPNFRRADARVQDESGTVLQVSTIFGNR
jgi:general secretion pathway protein I